ncbi:hypothetical protein BDF19DRAFT_426775 [Syncephalis fuscata]|nr:hypothetical protein BDF19DRAFT_426775 [Syncephalis fuscata]
MLVKGDIALVNNIIAKIQNSEGPPSCIFPSCSRPRLVENKKIHMFCSNSCRVLWTYTLDHSTLLLSKYNSQIALCRNQGCNLPCYKKAGTNLEYSYCGRNCGIKDMNREEGPRLLCLAQNSADFMRVWKKFNSTMNLKTIATIYRIYMPKTVREQYGDALGKHDVNCATVEYFHGTIYYDNGISTHNSSNICDAIGCRVCGIIKNGLLISCAVSGPRIWLAKKATISSGYARNTTLKSMFLCSVVASAITPTTETDVITVDQQQTILPKFLIYYQ